MGRRPRKRKLARKGAHKNPTPPKLVRKQLHRKEVIIDLKGHCLFCFEKASLSAGSGFVEELESFEEYWSYIGPNLKRWNGLSPNFVLKGETPEEIVVQTKVPPSCSSCTNQILDIVRCQKEIIELEKRLEELRGIINRSREAFQERMNSKDFLESMEDLGLAEGSITFLSRLRSRSVNNAQILTRSHVRSTKRKRSHPLLPNSEKTDSLDMKWSGRQHDMNMNTMEWSPDSPNLSFSPIDSIETTTSNSFQSQTVTVKVEPDVSFSYDVNSENDALEDNDLDFSSELKYDRDLRDDEEQMPSSTNAIRNSESKRPIRLKTVKVKKSKAKPKKISKVLAGNLWNKCEICGARITPAENYDHMLAHVGDEYIFRCPTPNCKCAFLSRYSNAYNQVHLRFCGRGATPKTKRICEVCGEHFQCLRLFGTHLKRHETFDKNFTCPIENCGETFTIKQSVEYHMRNHAFLYVQMETHQDCSECGIFRVSPTEMEAHLREKHSVEHTVHCHYCDFVFENHEELVEHLTTHLRKGGVQCSICPKQEDNEVFIAGRTLRDHYRIVHQIGKKLKCKLCEFSANSAASLFTHKRRIHDRKTVTFTCDICSKEFKIPNMLKEHKIIVHGATPLKCRFCEETFTRYAVLDNHEKTVHLGVEVKVFECPLCGKRLSSQAKVRYHMGAVHSVERKYACKEESCGKAYKCMGGLTNHMKRSHSGIRHVCETCGKSFVSQQILQNHQFIHTGEMPYLCKLCGSQFRNGGTYWNHMKGHERKGSSFKGAFGRMTKGNF